MATLFGIVLATGVEGGSSETAPLRCGGVDGTAFGSSTLASASPSSSVDENAPVVHCVASDRSPSIDDGGARLFAGRSVDMDSDRSCFTSVAPLAATDSAGTSTTGSACEVEVTAASAKVDSAGFDGLGSFGAAAAAPALRAFSRSSRRRRALPFLPLGVAEPDGVDLAGRSSSELTGSSTATAEGVRAASATSRRRTQRERRALREAGSFGRHRA